MFLIIFASKNFPFVAIVVSVCLRLGVLDLLVCGVIWIRFNSDVSVWLISFGMDTLDVIWPANFNFSFVPVNWLQFNGTFGSFILLVVLDLLFWQFISFSRRSFYFCHFLLNWRVWMIAVYLFWRIRYFFVL